MKRWCGAAAFRRTACSRRPRAWYAPIVYLEPFNENNRLAFGFDTASEPRRRAALEQARDSGQPAMSGSIRLVQETDARAVRLPDRAAAV
jgi:CHASE1-domain containing sensor protein